MLLLLLLLSFFKLEVCKTFEEGEEEDWEGVGVGLLLHA